MGKEDRSQHIYTAEEIRKNFIKSLRNANNDDEKRINKKNKRNIDIELDLAGRMHDAGQPAGHSDR